MPTNPPWVQALTPATPSGPSLLAAERAKSALDTAALTAFLFDADELAKKHEILAVLQRDPVFDKKNNYFDGRVDRFRAALGRAKRLRQLAVEHEWSLMEHNVAVDLIGEALPYGLHGTMFLLTLFNQSTPAQQKRYFMPAMAYNIIGCYAQTELGHGSNVRGLETTATWNPATQDFTIHSPTLTASKWWIGSLGRTANHAVVMAQLWIGGECKGPHPFVVNIRDVVTHEPLEGVCVGDVGPKFGYNTMDNGFLLFNNVRVPHEAMLAKYSRVDKATNTYIPPASASLSFGTMTWVRARLVWQSGGVLARGVTIATRYCCVRRQFKDADAPEDQEGETQVLDYSMVSYRLLPLLAACFALHFTGRLMLDMYESAQESMQRDPGHKESLALMADLHATSCGLKSLSTTIAAGGLETARRACGGHGYSSFSGIGQWYADYLPNTTWEGDNYMLTQQVARYMMKAARAVIAREKQPAAAPAAARVNDTTTILTHYRARADMGAAFDVLGNDADVVGAFAWRAAHLTFEAQKQRDELRRPWNDLLVDFYRLSNAHSQYLVVKNFHDTLLAAEEKPGGGSGGGGGKLDAVGADVLHDLFRLFALHTLETEAAEFVMSGAITVRQGSLIRTSAVGKLLKKVRPHAVRLVDAWDFPDWQLDSSLGRADGRVYEDMFERASGNPLNDVVVDPYPASAVLFKRDGRSKL